MTRPISWLLVAAFLPLAAFAGAAPLPRFGAEVWVLDESPFLYPVAAGQTVRIRFPVGELEIEAAAVSEVRAELETECRDLSPARCEKYRGRLRLEGRLVGDTVEVRLTGLPKWKLRKLHLEGRITVPRTAPLVAQIGVGDVDIAIGDQDLAVAMGIGDLTIRVAEEGVSTVRMATLIGDASLRGKRLHEGARRMLLGARMAWSEGEGPAHIVAQLRIGDATVVLE